MNLTNARVRLFKNMVLGTFHLMDNTPNHEWSTDNSQLQYVIGEGVTPQGKEDCYF